MTETPLIAHVIHRLAVGGLENGLVNLVNTLPADRFRHLIICLTEASDFASRIKREGVNVVELRKPPGNSLRVHRRLSRIFTERRPTIVHSRNLGTLEAQVTAAWARVPVRIHGEHGWDVDDADGSRRRHALMRRAFSPFVHRYVAVSSHIETYLRERVGVASNRIERICNGVDCERFQPASGARAAFPHAPFRDPQLVLVGAVGRLEAIKDPTTLARAFVALIEREPEARRFLRLVMVGSGSLQLTIEELLRKHDMLDLCWMAGERHDVPGIMQALDVFVLSSRAEGISNTILEAMACGLPVIATAVGGNPELIRNNVTGVLVPSNRADVLGDAILRLAREPAGRSALGATARAEAVERFGLGSMVSRYAALYESELARRVPRLQVVGARDARRSSIGA